MYIQLIIDHSQWKQTILFLEPLVVRKFLWLFDVLPKLHSVYDFDEYVKLTIAKFEYMFCYMTISGELKCEWWGIAYYEV